MFEPTPQRNISPSRKLTYPTKRAKEEHWLKSAGFKGDMLVFRREKKQSMAEFPVPPRFSFIYVYITRLPSKLLLQWWGTEPWRTWKLVSRRSSCNSFKVGAEFFNGFAWGEDKHPTCRNYKLHENNGSRVHLVGLRWKYILYLGDVELALLKVLSSCLLFNVSQPKKITNIFGMPECLTRHNISAN